MAETRSIAPADLLIDNENPRLIKPNTGQRDAQREIAKDQNRKLLALAKDIVAHGLNPSELPIVLALNDDRKRYTVLEGNRRLTALKALENPEWLVGAVDNTVLLSMRQLSKDYQKAPLEHVVCMVVKKREEAEHWIKLRHTGENEGVGVVTWKSDQASRFGARTKGLEPHTQVLDFLEKRGDLTPESRAKVPATILKRILISNDVKEKVGIEVEKGELRLRGAEQSVANALMYVINDITSKNGTKTKHVFTAKQRSDYAKKIPASVAVKLTKKKGEGVTLGKKATATKGRPKKREKPRQRDNLIPEDCVLAITVKRIREVEDELRYLSLEDYANAASVLFRVFLELSADEYCTSKKITRPANDSLFRQVHDVLADLLTRKKLTQQQATPVRKALQKNSLLAPSISMMHDYVHNQYIFPAPSDLRVTWDNLQPFITAIWSP